jgi:CheY-like chemotaxis protein
VDNAAARSQSGLGIGLTLVKSLVELHGGTVTVHSAGAGMGSEFVVRLPLIPITEQMTGGEPGRTRPAAPSRRVLVVDDHADAADSLAMLLRMEGHEVRVARSGPAAVREVRADRPEVILLDLGMPGMDGFEVARQLRQSPGLTDICLVALTGWGQEEDRRRTREAGFDDHFVKPVDPDDLRALLARGQPTR